MAYVFLLTDVTNTAGAGSTLAASDMLVIDRDASTRGSTFGVFIDQGSRVYNAGAIFGGAAGISNATTLSFSYVKNSLGGDISSADSGISVLNYIYLENYGTVSGGSFGVRSTSGSNLSEIYNRGTISAANSGYAISLTGGGTIQNDGVIYGNVIASATLTFNSTYGAFYGALTGSASIDTIIGGTVTCQLYGVAGNDTLYANPTQLAADNHATTTLSGGTGNNALYGGGGFNLFDPGANSAGSTNQIWGARSMMSDVTGYLNNTLTFGNVFAGVYVDLLNGHNAYVNDNAAAWDGTGFFQDWIVNVPNITGSLYGDVIQMDGTGGTARGGGGADALYGATGRDVFKYSFYSDSNTSSGYDTIVGFERGTDKIDISDFMSANGLSGSSVTIFGSGNSSTVYIERTPGTFAAGTDLAFVVNSTAGVLTASDFIL